MMKSLQEKVDPRQAAVIVIDVQNDFCARGGFMDREGQDLSMVEAMIPRLKRFLENCREVGMRIIFIQSIYGTEPNWYLSPVWLDRAGRIWKKGAHTRYRVCGKGEWGSEFFDGIGPDPSRPEIVVNKHRFSAFVNTELELILRSLNIQTVLLTGVATNVCVESAARDAFMRDYYVVLVEDCCATYDQRDHEATLRNINDHFGVTATSDEIAQIWQSARERV